MLDLVFVAYLFCVVAALIGLFAIIRLRRLVVAQLETRRWLRFLAATTAERAYIPLGELGCGPWAPHQPRPRSPASTR